MRSPPAVRRDSRARCVGVQAGCSRESRAAQGRSAPVLVQRELDVPFTPTSVCPETRCLRVRWGLRECRWGAAPDPGVFQGIGATPNSRQTGPAHAATNTHPGGLWLPHPLLWLHPTAIRSCPHASRKLIPDPRSSARDRTNGDSRSATIAVPLSRSAGRAMCPILSEARHPWGKPVRCPIVRPGGPP